jgi:hypothetical protein
MPDNWTFVAAAYTVAALAFGTYWRWLGKKEREINTLRGRNGTGRNAAARNDRTGAVRNDASAAVGTDRSTEVRNDQASRSHHSL